MDILKRDLLNHLHVCTYKISAAQRKPLWQAWKRHINQTRFEPYKSGFIRILQAITERAAAVIGNLSSTTQFFPAIRECGGLQRLVALVDAGPDAKVTEIAAKSLANMADNENNRKGIELAGGRPALINLLTQGPSAEVEPRFWSREALLSFGGFSLEEPWKVETTIFSSASALPQQLCCCCSDFLTYCIIYFS